MGGGEGGRREIEKELIPALPVFFVVRLWFLKCLSRGITGLLRISERRVLFWAGVGERRDVGRVEMKRDASSSS